MRSLTSTRSRKAPSAGSSSTAAYGCRHPRTGRSKKFSRPTIPKTLPSVIFGWISLRPEFARPPNAWGTGSARGFPFWRNDRSRRESPRSDVCRELSAHARKSILRIPSNVVPCFSVRLPPQVPSHSRRGRAALDLSAHSRKIPPLGGQDTPAPQTFALVGGTARHLKVPLICDPSTHSGNCTSFDEIRLGVVPMPSSTLFAQIADRALPARSQSAVSPKPPEITGPTIELRHALFPS